MAGSKRFGHGLIQDLYQHWQLVHYDDDHPSETYLGRWSDYGPIAPQGTGKAWSAQERVPIMNDVQRVTQKALHDLPESTQHLVGIVYGEDGTMVAKSEKHNLSIRALASARRQAIRAVERAVNGWIRSLS